ncbi:hypothetical protein INT48_002389 [Thamnidium elegans]|uniref:Uncharacterized protein n=1 Tax=Thamnidium elegans TaxID=101142 RepID=A0A8H7SSN6_9FUNG|nr:hypothetical protein INT48_002389 [Thamnidium elegans]
MICAVEKSLQQKVSRSKDICKRLSLEDDVSQSKFRIIKAATNVLSKVLRNIISEEIKEQELSIRLVNPFLSGLVNDPDKDVLLRLTGLITVERKHRGITKKRPDITTTTLNIFNFGPSIGFDEVKQESKANNNHALSKYLIRVALFAKSSTNNNNIKGILTYNIVGRSAIFYINIVLHDGLRSLFLLPSKIF